VILAMVRLLFIDRAGEALMGLISAGLD